MIITDISKLKIKCKETTVEECQKLDIFAKLMQELRNSSVKGVGLAANQIGYDIAACIIATDDKEPIKMINPQILESIHPVISSSEGCLSFPGVRVNTDRYQQVICSWLDYDTATKNPGKWLTDELKASFFGFDAIVVQHEVDHLNGIVFLDRVTKVSPKIGRNDPCPCGSGKKYKKCCIDKEDM